MAEANGDYEIALASGGSILASLDAWLAVPAPSEDWTLSIAFDHPAGGDVATALPIVGEHHRIEARMVGRAGPTIFGTFHRSDIAMPAPASLDGGNGATTNIDLAVLDATAAADAAALAQWVADSGRTVAEFWRGFPVERPLIVLVPVAGSGVPYGRVVSVGGVTAMILVGRDTDVTDLYQDWVLIHEMLHLGSPHVRDTGPWLNEGIATLYEPIVRTRAGWKTREEVWREWIEWMPNGLRAMGEVGLEEAMGGGVYWGGALFLLLAEIEVRERSALALGVEDCLRAVRDQGGTIDRIWATGEMLAVCDAALGGTTLADLAARHLGPGKPPDLDALWAQLGVSMTPDGTILFDDAAALAAVRDAILDGGPAARWQPVPIAFP
jgi:predicted metalloprotease with PDZ domain